MHYRKAFVAGVLFASVVTGQGRRSGGRPGNSAGSPDAIETAVVHFEGILRNLDKKTLRIDLNDGQSLVFRRSKNTVLVPAKDQSIQNGAKVQVEAHKDKVGDLDAVRVCEGTCPTNR